MNRQIRSVDAPSMQRIPVLFFLSLRFILFSTLSFFFFLSSLALLQLTRGRFFFSSFSSFLTPKLALDLWKLKFVNSLNAEETGFRYSHVHRYGTFVSSREQTDTDGGRRTGLETRTKSKGHGGAKREKEKHDSLNAIYIIRQSKGSARSRCLA